MTKLAQRLAIQTEISSERIMAVAQYLRRKLRRQSADKRPISLTAYRNLRIFEEALSMRDPKLKKRQRCF